MASRSGIFCPSLFLLREHGSLAGDNPGACVSLSRSAQNTVRGDQRNGLSAGAAGERSIASFGFKIMARPAGLEPATHSVEAVWFPFVFNGISRMVWTGPDNVGWRSRDLKSVSAARRVSLL
jgi:hypothetical protein